jgi:serine/threonine protein kinase
MSVEPSELMSEVWTRWQGHLVNGVFPLGRCLGCSDHSGVFLTRSPARASELAIKLVPTNRNLAETQLPRWKRAGALAHPHLLRLLEWGGCQLDGLPYLYAVMEYADQTLAQLLLKRALTDEEAREMLLPILDALAFLHGRSMLQGQLKPANILVVGDQLKLASDTIRRVSEGRMSTGTSSIYDPPETGEESSSTAVDMWALGVSLFEALTRRAPSPKPGEAFVLAADFSPVFRDVVGRCLNPDPEDRPSVTELVRWAHGESTVSAPAVTSQPAPVVPIPPMPTEPARPSRASAPVPTEGMRRGASVPMSPKPQAWLGWVLAAMVIIVLAWMGMRLLRTSPKPAPAPPAQLSGGSSSQSEDLAGGHPAAEVRPPSEVSTARAGRSNSAATSSALHEVVPDISPGARRTIHGHIKVWVRVTVGRDGSVSGTALDRAGSSSYFQRVALDAAKKWTFPPVDNPSQRLMQIRFDFSHDGATANAVAVH